MNERLYRSRSDRMLAGVAGGLAEMWDADPSLVRIVWALLALFTGGLALVVYIVMAIVVPEEEEVWPAGPAVGPIPTPDAAAGAGVAPAIDPATGAPLAPPPPAPGTLWAPTTPADARRSARADARTARRAARAARRDGGGLSPTVIGGLILVALGVFFLAREWLPQFDFDWFWPAVLIGLGVLLLVGALSRSSSEPSAVEPSPVAPPPVEPPPTAADPGSPGASS